ncbi:MAG: DUF423 domain-containing protein [Opitutaceae bacterium]
MKSPKILLASAFFGATGVGLGAFGAHALRDLLTEYGTRDRWETAVLYQLVHTVALLGAAAWARTREGRSTHRIGWAACFWTAGIFLFCGSLYLLAVTTTAPLWFRIAVPPLGGTAFVIGWLWVAGAAFANDE